MGGVIPSHNLYFMIVKNSIKTPDGTEIISKHRHDMICHVDSTTGKEYCVDGGYDYLRRVGPSDFEDTSITIKEEEIEDSIDTIRENMYISLAGGEILIKDVPKGSLEQLKEKLDRSSITRLDGNLKKIINIELLKRMEDNE